MISFDIKSTESYQCDIYIAGNTVTIEETCAAFCEKGACVSITPITYVYTAGRESGAKVTFISYARFPKGRQQWKQDALCLAKQLIKSCHQHSCTVIDDEESLMVTRKLSAIKEK